MKSLLFNYFSIEKFGASCLTSHFLMNLVFPQVWTVQPMARYNPISFSKYILHSTDIFGCFLGLTADQCAWRFLRAVIDEAADLLFKHICFENAMLTSALFPKHAVVQMVRFSFFLFYLPFANILWLLQLFRAAPSCRPVM